MAEWSTIASLATAGGTLVLAIATFSSVRYGQRAARVAERSTSIAERALLIGMRPVLVGSRPGDPLVDVRFADDRMVSADGGMAGVQRGGATYYFVVPLRNVGNGLAVIQAWRLDAARALDVEAHAAPDEFRRQGLDLYVSAGDTGYWQGAIREPDDPFREGLDDAFASGERLTVDLLYGDHEGGQMTISRFVLTRQENAGWRSGAVRHWVLEGVDPRAH